MIVVVCEKCRYTDLGDVNKNVCPRCGARMVPSGLTSAQYNELVISGDDVFSEAESKAEPETQDENRLLPSESSDEPPKIKEPKIIKKPSYELDELSAPSRIRKKDIRAFSHIRDDEDAEAARKQHHWSLFPIIAIGFAIAAAAVIFFTVRRWQGIGTSDMPSELSASDDTEIAAYDFDNCLFYDSMSEEDREIYRIFYDLVMHKDESGYSRTLTMDYYEFERRSGQFSLIYHAMQRDHPEFFFLETSKGRQISMKGLRTSVLSTVTFRLGPGDPDENELIENFESAADEFMSDIDLSAPEEDIELQIHDKLIDMVAYDHDLIGRSGDDTDLGYTAYGALVADSEGRRNRAVCGGYASAFQYLLGRAGICAAYVSGYADSESGSLSEQGSHAWNIVRLDGEWYEVDCCWDDMDPMPDDPDAALYAVMKYEQPQYFYATHHWYNRTTDEMMQLPEDDRTVIRIQDGSQLYDFHHCSRSTHERKKDESDEGYEVFEFLNGYLPKAYGTKYSLDI
ncbi:MAG: hypothetical protein K6F73_08290 [Lachnospiraceae bacterium]|nr:hypothetical protein [Lachnospiraceae bacterium]